MEGWFPLSGPGLPLLAYSLRRLGFIRPIATTVFHRALTMGLRLLVASRRAGRFVRRSLAAKQRQGSGSPGGTARPPTAAAAALYRSSRFCLEVVAVAVSGVTLGRDPCFSTVQREIPQPLRDRTTTENSQAAALPQNSGSTRLNHDHEEVTQALSRFSTMLCRIVIAHGQRRPFTAY